MGERDPPAHDRPGAATALTQAQQLIWSGQQLNPGVPLYNTAFVFTIHGAIDRGCFEHSFGLLVQRCAELRTVIDSIDGVPQQRIADDTGADIEYLDLSAEQDPDRAARRWAEQRCRLPFDLAQRLYDSVLIRLADDRYAWYLCQHHVACDAWSMTILFDELSRIYASLSDGREPAHTPLPAFSDYVTYEAQARDREAAAEYWQRVRQQAPPPAALYGRRGVDVTTDSVRVPLELGPERSHRLRELALVPGIRTLSTDLALFNLFATLMFAYLFRISGQRELAIGTPAHNRPTPDFKRTVGLFIEVYPLQVTVGLGDSFRQLHDKVAIEVASLLRNAQPGASHPANNAGCNTGLNYIHASFRPFAGRPVDPLWLHPGHKDREHHLRLQVQDFGATDRFTLLLDFNTDVFDERRRGAAVYHLERLLDAFCRDLDVPIDGVDLLSDAERAWQVESFNTTYAVQQRDASVLSMFRRQVVANPDAVALVSGEQRVSYEQLQTLAVLLARTLQQRGLAERRIVAVCTRRSVATVVGMLGVMTAGYAYLPVDPDWPAERLATVIDDAGVAAVAVQPGLQLALPDATPVVTIPQQVGDEVIPPDAEPHRAAGPQDAAYVMYTSGSTGVPKGVVVRHDALANYIGWAASTYVCGRRLNFPLFTPLTFDLTVTSIFVPLISGGSVVIYRQEPGRADLALLDVIDDDRVDVVKLTPSHLALLAGRDLRRSRVGLLILGGEDLSVDLARQTLDMFGPDIEIYNEYGPTEGTVGCIVHRFDPTQDASGSVPIGSPIANMRAYVLDAAMRPQPEGVVGELYVGGTGLAAGYLDRDALTAERFIADPFRPGERLYRTGDLARFDERGRLVYLGRDDHQVKIRGARIEIGEIEQAIATQPEVDACVVSTYTSAPRATPIEPARQAGDQRLVAYVVGSDELSMDALRVATREALPDFMLPSHFIRLDRIPLSGNGKVDRDALPAPDDTRPELDSAFVPPRSPDEVLLAGIWRDVLRLKEVGVRDNFFELGGDSIVAIQIVARARRHGLHILPALLVDNPTIAQLAAAIRHVADLPSSAAPEGPPLLLPMAHWLFEQPPAVVGHWNHVLELRLKRRVPVERLQQALATVLDRHDAFAFAYVHEDDAWRMRRRQPDDTPGGGAFRLRADDLSGLDAAGQRAQIETSTAALHADIDLADGCLLAASLFDLDGNRQALVLCVHHLAVDAVSWSTLLEELSLICVQLGENRAPVLPPPSVTAQQWAAHLTRVADDGLFRAELPLWQDALGAAADTAPPDAPAATYATVDTYTAYLGPDATGRLLEQLPRKGRATVAEVLIAALARTLCDDVAETKVRLFLEGHGRQASGTALDVARTLGWFTSLYPLTIPAPADGTPAAWLREAKERVRAVPAGGVGFGALRYLAVGDTIRRESARCEMEAVLFNHLGAVEQFAAADPLFDVNGPLELSRHADARQRFRYEVSTMVVGGRLMIQWSHDRHRHSAADIARLVERFRDGVVALTGVCLSDDTIAVSASDFPLADLDSGGLDKLAAVLGNKRP